MIDLQTVFSATSAPGFHFPLAARVGDSLHFSSRARRAGLFYMPGRRLQHTYLYFTMHGVMFDFSSCNIGAPIDWTTGQEDKGA